MTQGSPCTDNPVYATGVMSPGGSTGSFSGVSQSGFILNGEYQSGTWTVTGLPSTLTTDITATDVMGVSEVVWDQW